MKECKVEIWIVQSTAIDTDFEPLTYQRSHCDKSLAEGFYDAHKILEIFYTFRYACHMTVILRKRRAKFPYVTNPPLVRNAF